MKMKLEELYKSPRFVEIEEAILAEEGGRMVNENDYKRLMQERRRFLNDAFVFDDENARLLQEFNENLRKALTEQYYKARHYYDEVMGWNDSKDLDVVSRLKLGGYPALHPVQTRRSHDVWSIMSYGCYDPYYDLGISNELLFQAQASDESDTLAEYLYLDKELTNWNECLPKEWSKGMNLLYGFHNLYAHTWFSLYDIIYVREFEQEFQIRITR